MREQPSFDTISGLTERERFDSNSLRDRPPGLGLTLRIDLGEQADETLAKIQEVISAWIPIAERVWLEHGPFPSDEEYPPPEELEGVLPLWFIEALKSKSPEQVPGDAWRLDDIEWLDAIENRCWQWWSYRRDGALMTVRVVVDGLPCPVGELVCLARLAGAVSVDIEW